MKNFINSSLKKKIQNGLLMVICLFTTMNLVAQVSVTIDTPPDGSAYCAELGTNVTFTATAMDGATVIPNSSISWQWNGPNLWSSTLPSPSITLNDVSQGGQYSVTATFTSGEVATDDIMITVDNVFDMTCPDDILVTPDLDDINCVKTLVFDGFQIDNVNCTGLAYEYEITYLDENSVEILPDPLTVPPSNSIDNNLSNEVYADGITYEDLPFGFHTLRIDLNQSGGGATLMQCVVNVDVVESRNNLACNDLINLTLNSQCEALVTPDMVLQGDYCFDLFGLTIENMETGDIQNGIGSLTIDAPALYTVTVTGQTGLSCWGQIFAEDKSVPILDCEDAELYCSQIESILPGTRIMGFDRGRILNSIVGSGTSVDYDLDLQDIGGEIDNVVLNFHAEIDSVKDLELTLTSPEGTTITLLDLDDVGFVNVCEGSNINVCLSDDGELAYGMFGSAVHCRATQNAFIGSFRPQNSFSSFSGEDADNGSGLLTSRTWTLSVSNGSATSDITLIDVDLQVYTSEGNILGDADIIQSDGCSGGQNFVYVDEQIGGNCENEYWQIIERTWTVTNTASGLSASCTQTLNLKQWTLDDIIWPKSYDDLQQPSLNCNDLTDDDLNANNVPLPEFAGEPRVPFGDICGNFQTTYNDLTFDICGPLSKKTIRTWSILDWCSGEIAEYDQTIKVVDREPITLSCVPDNISDADALALGYDKTNENYIAYTDFYACSGSWIIVPPVISGNQCGDSLAWEVYYLIDDDENPDDAPTNGIYINTNVVDENEVNINNSSSTGIPYAIEGLPVGRRTWIKMVVTDECGNTGECFTEVDVLDDVQPNPVCIEYTVLSLGQDGCGRMEAESLDNGSYDNCGVVDFEVRKQNSSVWADTVSFCCDCNVDNYFVVLRVSDEAGNSNTCLVEVEVQDNIPPMQGDTPQGLYTFDCSTSPVDLTDIIDESKNQFTWFDNCAFNYDDDGMINIFVRVENESAAKAPFVTTGCGGGSRTVRYIIEDDCREQLGQFTQRFSFFNPTVTNGSFNVRSWPRKNVNINECTSVAGLEPENLSSSDNADAIVVDNDYCNEIAIGWDDVYFPDVEDACLKIIRTWTVIDWCIVNAQGLAAGSESYEQIIKVDDSIAPDIDVTSVYSMNSTSSNCYTQTDTSALVANITDDCTDMFAGEEISFYHSIEYADSTSSGIVFSDDANGAYPFGESTITWYAEDHCGNVEQRTTRVFINDTKAPTPYCLGSVVTATMNTDGSAVIWASDFDLGGADNYTGNEACNNFNELDVYFLDGSSQVQSLEFNCDDILDGVSQEIPLELYYEDEYGNRDFCVVILLLQDNAFDICENPIGSMVEGNVRTLNSDMLEDVRVELKSNASEFSTFDMTDANGHYAFTMPTGKNYSISASMEDNPLNGVSTVDLVLIQRHVLGLTTLDSPYKVIAADADNSGSVNVIDLITIRKLILGVTDDFPNDQKSWRFPEENQPFTDQYNPFPYSESIEIFNFAGSMSNQDIMGVKIGDVNLSATVNALGSTEVESRSQSALNLEVENIEMQEGENVIIPVYARDMNDIVGFQNTLNFNADVLSFVSVQSEALEIGDDNLGTQNLEAGELSLSWNSIDATTIDEDTPLFNLEFDVKQNAELKNLLYASSSITKAEAYNSNLEVMDVNILFRGVENADLVLYQNVPNPFLETTDVRFSIPSTSHVVFTVFDVNGREILRKADKYTAGIHTIRLTRDELNSTGVMYYQIETNSGTASKKMIQIR
ncbi:MAG: T9SS type A sorting domain-containing protein [Saprospiraceae bacterium]|nr:T9SS type A sorting domain-containing protein [Saprospiraceae bacterium]